MCILIPRQLKQRKLCQGKPLITIDNKVKTILNPKQSVINAIYLEYIQLQLATY